MACLILVPFAAVRPYFEQCTVKTMVKDQPSLASTVKIVVCSSGEGTGPLTERLLVQSLVQLAKWNCPLGHELSGFE